MGLFDEQLKIQLKAPPVAGKANIMLICFLAEFCNCPKSSITIKSSLNGCRKRILINDIDRLPEKIAG